MLSNSSYILIILSRLVSSRFWLSRVEIRSHFLVEVLAGGITPSAFFLVVKSQYQHINRRISFIRDSLAGNIDFFHCQKSLILVFLVVVLVPLKFNFNFPVCSFSTFERHIFVCVQCKLCNNFAGFRENEMGEITFDYRKFTEYVQACSNKLYNNRKCIYFNGEVGLQMYSQTYSSLWRKKCEKQCCMSW